MILCLCEAVSDDQVRQAIEAGSRTVVDVRRACGAGRDCGACCVEIRELLRRRQQGLEHRTASQDPPNQ